MSSVGAFLLLVLVGCHASRGRPAQCMHGHIHGRRDKSQQIALTLHLFLSEQTAKQGVGMQAGTDLPR